MPIYEYRCRVCRYKFEVKQSFSDELISVCPKCTGKVVRIISPVLVIFKGGKPSDPKTARQPVGKSSVPIHQSEEGYWIQDNIKGI